VTDTGHGLPRSDFRRLFQPYFSTRGRGTGLGLAIVQRIISDHSGRIRAEANHPQGAKFRIEIPVIEETRKHAEAETRGREELEPLRQRVHASTYPEPNA
jgi:two-component system nitrogen regulation sensor histidine kinase NtrY